MALPEEVATVNLTGTYVNLDGTPTVGYLMFEPSAQILKAADSREFVVPKVMQVNLDEGGHFSIQLPANDDPDVEPLDWTYQVTEAFGARRTYNIEIHVAAGPDQNIYDLAPVARANGVFYEQGDRGPAGPPAIITTGKPADTVGADGDYALDAAAGKLYRKTGSTWDSGTLIGKSYIDNADAADQLYSDGKLSAHANTSSGTHGVVGILVGTTDTQTLSNKILSAPSVTGGLNADTVTTTGTATVGSLKVNGAVDATGQTITAAHISVANDPTASTDAATKNYVDNTAGDKNATANALVRRDATGNTAVGALWLNTAMPDASPQWATRKDYVDSADALRVQLGGDLGGTVTVPTVTGGTHHTHTSAQVSDATSAATASMVAKRDAAGRLQVVDPSVAADVATKNYTDTQTALRVPLTSKNAANGYVGLDASSNATVAGTLTASGLTKAPNFEATTAVLLDNQASDPSAPGTTGQAALWKASTGLWVVSQDAILKRRLQVMWPSATAFPTAGIGAGDTVLRTDLGTNGSLWQYTGSASLGSAGWITEGPIVCTSTTRPTAGLYTGLQIFETDTNKTWTYLNSSWLLQVGDTGWIDMTTGWTGGAAIAIGSDGAHYRALNGVLFFQIHMVTSTATTTGNIFTFPTNLRPGFNLWWNAEANGNPQGEVKMTGSSGVLGLTARPTVNGSTAAVVAGSWPIG